MGVGRYEEAVIEFKKALQLKPDDMFTHLALASTIENNLIEDADMGISLLLMRKTQASKTTLSDQFLDKPFISWRMRINTMTLQTIMFKTQLFMKL
jgi:hypothetical protein